MPNSAVVVDAQGKLCGVYRKTHLIGPTEASLFRAGDGLCVAEAAGLRLGIVICYDIEFPEVARALVRAGAQMICIPTANMEPFREAPTTLLRARALENGVSFIYANHCGRETDVTYMFYTALSDIIRADGTDFARADAGSDMLLVADLPGLLLATE